MSVLSDTAVTAAQTMVARLLARAQAAVDNHLNRHIDGTEYREFPCSWCAVLDRLVVKAQQKVEAERAETPST